ncbi:MAG: baseplate J/gp47 family protein [Chloroflexota bacterium]
MELYQIDPDSSAETVRRMLPRLRKAQVVLELPSGWSELDNMARMRLLQRQAQILQMDIALVTTHAETRRAARQTGIPVFHSPNQAFNSRWQMKPLMPLVDPKQPDVGLPEAPHWRRDEIVERINRPRVRRSRQSRIEAEERFRRPMPIWVRWLGNTIMGGMIGVLLLAFAFYVLPAATITLIPGQAPLEVVVELTADPSLDGPDLDFGLIPAQLVEKNIDEFGTIATSGSRQKASVKARGTVTFSNLTSRSATIPKGTVVSTSTGTPVRFTTQYQVELPGGLGQRVDVEVESVEPGFGSNVLANTINTVSGALSFRTSVTNRAGMYGGGSQLVPVVTAADRQALLESTTALAESKAKDVLLADLAPGEWMSPEAIQTFVIAQTFTQFDDEEADELGLNLRLLARGFVVDQGIIEEAALSAIQQQIPARGQLVAETLSFQRNPGTTNNGRTVSFDLTVQGDYVIPVDPSEVRNLVAGTRPEEATDLIQNRWLLASAPQIYRDPELLPTLPTIQSRIQVRINYQGSRP